MTQLFTRLNRLMLMLMMLALLPLNHASASPQADVYTIYVGSALDFADSNPNDTICTTIIGACTLRAAIQTANRRGGTATIRLQPVVYRLTINGANEGKSATGDLDITTNMNIIGSSLNGQRSEIDAAGIRDGVIEAGPPSGNITLSIDTVIIRNGDASPLPGTTFALSDAGGIVAHLGVDLLLSNCEVRDNTGSNLGGGIYVTNKATIRNCFIYGNKTSGYTPGLIIEGVDYNGGGGIASYGPLTIERSTIRMNRTAGNGGGIWDASGIWDETALAGPTLLDTMIDDNDATRFGGGMYTTGSWISLSNATISRNDALIGGGLYIVPSYDDPATSTTPTRLYGFSHSVFYDNEATSYGAGVHIKTDLQGQTTPIVATTSVFDRNITSSGSLQNCGYTVRFTGDGGWFASYYNVSSDNSCHFIDSTSKRNTPADLSGPVKFTTTVRAFVPAPGSPLIDARPMPCAGTDVRGVTRPQNGKCDIGAVEVVPRNAVGVPVLIPAASSVQSSQPFSLTLSWTHPDKWRDLDTVDLRLLAADGDTIPLMVRFTEGVTATSSLSPTVTITDGLMLLDSSGAVAGAGQPGSSGVLESDMATLDLAHSRFQPQGPNPQTVTLVLQLQLKAPAAGHRYTVEMLATNDDGTMQGPDAVGTLTAGPWTAFLPLLTQP